MGGVDAPALQPARIVAFLGGRLTRYNLTSCHTDGPRALRPYLPGSANLSR